MKKHDITVWFDLQNGRCACLYRHKRGPESMGPHRIYNHVSIASMRRLSHFATSHKDPGSVIPAPDGWLWLES